MQFSLRALFCEKKSYCFNDASDEKLSQYLKLVSLAVVSMSWLKLFAVISTSSEFLDIDGDFPSAKYCCFAYYAYYEKLSMFAEKFP